MSKQLVPLYIALAVLGIGICFGFNCGYAINPARDLAPRLFTGNTVCSGRLDPYYIRWVKIFWTYAKII